MKARKNHGRSLFALAAVACSVIVGQPAPCSAQSSQPALFVANNGNLEGSVTSFTVNADGSLNFVQRVVTPGSTNPQCIDLSPNGRWLCTGHGTISSTVEQLTFFEVGFNATMSIVLETTTPDSPVCVRWLDDQHIVVTNTSATPNDMLMVYRFDPQVPSITQVWFSTLGASTFDIAIDRAHKLLYPRATTPQVWPMTWNNTGVLTKLTTTPVNTGIYFLGPGVSPDGTKLYFGGGISSSGQQIGGFNVNTTTGTLTPMPGSPFISAGTSPKQVVVSSNGSFAYASHGTSGDVYGFSVNPATGVLTPVPGSYYDVGGQGNCSRMTVLNNRLYVMRYYSSPNDGVLAFNINADGTLTQIGGLYPTQGSLPWDIIAWPGPSNNCPADIDGSSTVDVTDLLAVIGAWGPCANPKNCPADINDSGTVDVTDLLAVIGAWGQCPNQ